jgi:hypothetical protein
MSEQLEAVKAALLRADGPMTLKQIRTAIKDEVKVSGEATFKKEMKQILAHEPGIYPWPEYRRSARYWSRSLASSVEEALLTALEDGPLTVPHAGLAVKKALRSLSEKRATDEARSLLPRLATAGKVISLAANRQSVIYLSRGWIAKLAQPEAAPEPVQDALSAKIPGAIARLQTGLGNYVRVDQLRHAPELCAVFDRAVIALADAGQLVLGAYDGPRPLPPKEKWLCVEDQRGELYIGVALPRSSPQEA